ncbi:hypothetical protein HPB51_028593 [Rhipicephalus microplus]|uniref:Ubiquitin-like protease family profile domain-containing protein n=1 Tax=Rhipicephalus microplus TaxID=6941 RepID=A0A9J6CWL5_RHIMP|nr:hypothetical protein HPB51_028593 [Rhipicephalus microplus]
MSAQGYVLIFDSLPKPIKNYSTIAENIRSFLTDEWRIKRYFERLFTCENFPLLVPQSPCQPNTSDCGIYILLNLERFFANPPKFGESVSMDRLLFSAEDAAQKRRSMTDFLLNLHTRQHPNSEFAASWRLNFDTIGHVRPSEAIDSTTSTRAHSPVSAEPEQLFRGSSPEVVRRRSGRITKPRRCSLPDCCH